MATIYAAAAAGDLDRLKELLAAESKSTGKGSVKPFLLKQERPVNRPNAETGNTVLHHASAAGFADMVKWLLENGADPDLRSKGGFIALHFASKMGHEDCVRLLARDPRDVRRTSKKGFNAVHFAALVGSIGCVSALLDLDPTAVARTNEDGEIPLHFAVTSGNVDLVNFLLERGSSIHTKSRHGWSPVHYSAKNPSSACLECLSHHPGFDLNALDDLGCTPLHWAVECQSLECVSWLVKNKAHLSLKNSSKYTPFHSAVFNGDLELTTLLLNAGSDIHSCTMGDNSPLHSASLKGYPDIVKLLVLAGADLNQRNAEGLTPLHFAAKKSHLDVCDTLLTFGADVNARTFAGESPLHLAALSVSTCRLLVSRGADPQQTKLQGGVKVKPGDIARSIGLTEASQYLSFCETHVPSLKWFARRTVRRWIPVQELQNMSTLPRPLLGYLGCVQPHQYTADCMNLEDEFGEAFDAMVNRVMDEIELLRMLENAMSEQEQHTTTHLNWERDTQFFPPTNVNFRIDLDMDEEHDDNREA